MTVGRRQLLAGLVATGATALAARSFAGPTLVPWLTRGSRIDPEPLQLFPGLGEGFYRLDRHVYYIDEQHKAWAPIGIAGDRLEPIAPLVAAALPLVLRQLRKRHWAWTVEHAVVRLLPTDRALAASMLAAAIDIDRARPALSSRRLYALDAALAEESPRAIWRSVGTDGRAFATRLAVV